MTREQAIDAAVRLCIKPRTMKMILRSQSTHEEAVAAAALPGGEKMFHPHWLSEESPFCYSRKRLPAIRAEFRRIMAAAE